MDTQSRMYDLTTVFVVLLISMGTALDLSALGMSSFVDLSSFVENKVEFVIYGYALIHFATIGLWFWVGIEMSGQKTGAAIGKSILIGIFGFSALLFPSFFTSSGWTLVCCMFGIAVFFYAEN